MIKHKIKEHSSSLFKPKMEATGNFTIHTAVIYSTSNNVSALTYITKIKSYEQQKTAIPPH